MYQKYACVCTASFSSLPASPLFYRALNPKALLKAASSPLPIFPSSSLLFPSQPRRPLTKKAPLITTPGGQVRTPLITTAPGGPPLIITPERETRAPVERKARSGCGWLPNCHRYMYLQCSILHCVISMCYAWQCGVLGAGRKALSEADVVLWETGNSVCTSIVVN